MPHIYLWILNLNRKETMKTHQNENKELLKTITTCATECEICFDACLENDRTEALLKVLRLCRDCAKICYSTASFIASNSTHAKHLAKECAEICKDCADSCGNHEDDEHECMACMEACRACEKACRRFAA